MILFPTTLNKCFLAQTQKLLEYSLHFHRRKLKILRTFFTPKCASTYFTVFCVRAYQHAKKQKEKGGGENSARRRKRSFWRIDAFFASVSVIPLLCVVHIVTSVRKHVKSYGTRMCVTQIQTCAFMQWDYAPSQKKASFWSNIKYEYYLVCVSVRYTLPCYKNVCVIN